MLIKRKKETELKSKEIKVQSIDFLKERKFS